jgi:cysteine-rich repeat protein
MRLRIRAPLTSLPLLACGALTLGTIASCGDFDPALYQQAEKTTLVGGAGGAGGAGGSSNGGSTAGGAGESSGGSSGESSGGASGSGGDSGSGGAPLVNWDKTADWCPLKNDQLLDSSQRTYTGIVRLKSLKNDVSEVPKAPGLEGPDGVLGVKLAATERVSVKYEVLPEEGQATAPPIDLAMYLMSQCDVAGYIRRNDRCPAGEPEDVWWQMNDVAGTYFLGFDSKPYDTAMYDPWVKLTVNFPRYGDGKVDPGEACDDGNTANGDGCTHDGLIELKNSSIVVYEKEPNNHPWGGNLLLLSSGQTMTIAGNTGQTCDNDFFAIDVPEGHFPRTTMLDGNGRDCPASVGKITMQLNELNGVGNLEQTKLGDGLPVAPNSCPSFDENSLGLGGLKAGRYVIELKGFEPGKTNIPYRLKVELADLSPSGGGG